MAEKREKYVVTRVGQEYTEEPLSNLKEATELYMEEFPMQSILQEP